LQTKQRGILGLNNLLGLRPAQRPTAQSRKVFQQDAVALGLAKAGVYKFATADYPGASQSIVFDNEGGTAIGTFQFGPTSPTTAFTFHAGVYEILSVPNSLASILTGINNSGQLVGVYADLASVAHGFLDNAGTFSDIDFPSATTTEAFDINNSGQIVGAYIDLLSKTHGFLDNGGVFTSIDFPGADSTIAAGINSAGRTVFCYAVDSSPPSTFPLPPVPPLSVSTIQGTLPASSLTQAVYFMGLSSRVALLPRLT
jgi:hypothetical protein